MLVVMEAGAVEDAVEEVAVEEVAVEEVVVVVNEKEFMIFLQ